MLHSYPKILPLVGKYADLVLNRPVEVTEKIDGSMFAFGKDAEGNLHMRSKGTLIDATERSLVPNLFRPAVDHVLSIQDRIPANTAFYAETLASPRHNTLVYERVPHNHIALFGAFDFDRTAGQNYDQLAAWATLFDVDCVPLVASATFTTAKDFLDIVQAKPISFLGKAAIEGIVIKDYTRPCEFNGMVYPLTVLKLVSEEFKEKHADNPDWKSHRSKVDDIIERYRTQARWLKAIHHLRDKGELVGEPKDIGILMKEIHTDLMEECKKDFMEELYEAYQKGWKARVAAGFPEFYKNLLITEELNVS